MAARITPPSGDIAGLSGGVHADVVRWVGLQVSVCAGPMQTCFRHESCGDTCVITLRLISIHLRPRSWRSCYADTAVVGEQRCMFALASSCLPVHPSTLSGLDRVHRIIVYCWIPWDACLSLKTRFGLNTRLRPWDSGVVVPCRRQQFGRLERLNLASEDLSLCVRAQLPFVFGCPFRLRA